MRTVLIDYDSGNLHSAEKAFQRMALERNAGEVIVSDRAEDVASADRIVLPGDGAFPACRSQLLNALIYLRRSTRLSRKKVARLWAFASACS